MQYRIKKIAFSRIEKNIAFDFIDNENENKIKVNFESNTQLTIDFKFFFSIEDVNSLFTLFIIIKSTTFFYVNINNLYIKNVIVNDERKIKIIIDFRDAIIEFEKKIDANINLKNILNSDEILLINV